MDTRAQESQMSGHVVSPIALLASFASTDDQGPSWAVPIPMIVAGPCSLPAATPRTWREAEADEAAFENYLQRLESLQRCGSAVN